ncbi:hypothetical protein CPB83DRAFT_419356 [Crepidotus variabilis]|uniref:Uncharacterized protein n=1 Tax=Crepidotus variabilis TaxID=179855 RepID=A0A9P6JU99_9AGAR|nr:hypothetical protein CPB83DRAFT_419356 [Crepidotus variabilis]
MVLNIHMKIAGYEVSVSVDGAEVEHCKIEVDEEKKTATCWVASEEGKRFALKGRKTHTWFDCTYSVRLDGHDVGGKYLFIGNSKLLSKITL